MSDYEDTIVFRGSCPKCGLFQIHHMDMCKKGGSCLVLHYYPDIKCECGTIIWHGNMRDI